MYEVILLLSNEADCAHNPSFSFGSKDLAMQLAETFMSQGYKALIHIREDH